MTELSVIEIHEEAIREAKLAEQAFYEKHGEPFYCGFAWVKFLMDGRKPITKQMVKAGIIEKAWDRGYIIWNPAGNNTQSMDIKEAGAEAYAKVFRKYGFLAYAQSRAD